VAAKRMIRCMKDVDATDGAFPSAHTGDVISFFTQLW
jgi:hypothetical protein